ncbi:hypothetical protein E4O86_02935 [Rhizobiales bacterium L72]|uniref:Uncharacterized protein n=1 Tax=Propylenella binzhouense TaxID=2555902 RepID=A0A964T1S6_9HYPH|nr:hypothetical protein [Propylenella binzhouense]
MCPCGNGTSASAKKRPAEPWLYEEANHHGRPADPTDPGDAADLSKSMGYPKPKKACLQLRLTIGAPFPD